MFFHLLSHNLQYNLIRFICFSGLLFLFISASERTDAQVKITTTNKPRPLIQKETGPDCNDMFFVQKGILKEWSGSSKREKNEDELKRPQRKSINRVYGISKPNSAPLQRGDVLVGIDSARIRHYDSLGTYLGDLQMPFDSTFSHNKITGMMTDWDGNLYATLFQDSRIGKFDASGTYLGYFDGVQDSHPESITKNLAGDIYVGIADYSPFVAVFYSYDEHGTLLNTHGTYGEWRGTDWIELSRNQKSLYYTSEGRYILNYNLLNVTLDAFAVLPGGIYTSSFALRELPNGEVLVVSDTLRPDTTFHGFVYRLDANGNIVQTYSRSGSAYFFGMTIGLDGNTFWVSDYESGLVYNYDIVSGAILNTIDVGADGYYGSTGGIFVYGEQGNYSTARIGGMKFLDLNQNGFHDKNEPARIGYPVLLEMPDGSEIVATTDSLGIYQFENLLPGNYIVRDSLPTGWWSTNPGSDQYAVTITNNETVGKKNFGEYAVNTLGGVMYKDQNANGLRDPDEVPLPNERVYLYADIGQFHPIRIDTFLRTDSLGYFVFQGPPGLYSIYSDGPYNWSQTQPPDFEAYEVLAETVSMTLTNLDFGLAPPEYQNYYFTFNPESLALSKDNRGKIGFAVKKKPDKVKFKVRMYNDQDSINGMYIEFINEMNENKTPTVNLHGKTTTGFRYSILDSKRKKWYFYFGTARLYPGDSVTINGIGNKGSLMKVPTFFWTKDSMKVGLNRKNATYIDNDLLLPRPNRLNIVDELFTQGGFDSTSGFIVGIPRKDSAKRYGWVHMKRMADVHKSLYELKRSVVNLHDSAGRGFEKFSNGKPFVGKLGTLPPSKQDNSLFANQVALKISILASAMEKTQLGLGELIYDDRGTNPLNGKMVKEIAAMVDSALTGKPGRGFASAATFRNLDTTIRQIVNAFEGIFDSISFSTKTVIYGDIQLLYRPFLRVNPDVVPAKIIPRLPENEEPMGFALHQNYPNPFNPTTNFGFRIANFGLVTLKIYNLLGQEIATLLNQEALEEGEHEVTFDAGVLS
ncbi:MAG: hypothetical protein HYZ34_06450, partial [Ignavibacteriae bacterium]|nr:hypothetical protein [Ignavibacteriota bacterium]